MTRGTAAARISPKVIFCGRVTAGMAHDRAERAGSEAAGYWASAAFAHYGARWRRGCVQAAADASVDRDSKLAWRCDGAVGRGF
jgi:hypothetical protein